MANKNETKYGSCQTQECMNYGMSSVIPADGNCPICHQPMKAESDDIAGGDDFNGFDDDLNGESGGKGKSFTPIILAAIASILILGGGIIYFLLGRKTMPKSITLNKKAIELTIGDVESLQATITPTEAASESILLWKVEGTAVTVKNGFVKAVKEGVATVTVQIQGVEGVKTFCVVNVKPASVHNVDVKTLSVPESTIELMIDSVKQLSVTKNPLESDETIKWSISDEKIAVIDSETGIITAKNEGVAVVTAKTNRTGKTVAVAVTIKKPEQKQGKNKGGDSGKKTVGGNSSSISVLNGNGTYSGDISGGKPHGNGIIRIKRSCKISGYMIPAGSRIEGVFRDGWVNLGTFFTPDGDAIHIKDLKVK